MDASNVRVVLIGIIIITLALNCSGTVCICSSWTHFTDRSPGTLPVGQKCIFNHRMRIAISPTNLIGI
jgi:hypothetical protein